MKISSLFQILIVLAVLFSTATIEAQSVKTQCPSYFIPCEPKQTRQDESKPTVMTFYIELDIEQQQDYIQMSLTVKQKDTSLKKAIDKVTRKVQSIKTACANYCLKNKGQNCQERVSVDNFKVEPAYQIVRRQPIFNDFIVTHQIKVIVYETLNIGQLVDSLLGLGIYQIDQLEWKPNVEVDSTEKAIDAGITKGKQLCHHINREMGTVLSIQQVFFEDQQQQKDDDQGGNQQQEQGQQDVGVLEFKIQCIDKPQQKADNKQNKKKVEADKKDKKKTKK